MELTRKKILADIEKKGLYADDYENIIEFVLELVEDDLAFTKENNPNSTISIGKMMATIDTIKNLRGLTDIDEDVEYIMEQWNIEEEDVDTILSDQNIEASELADFIRSEQVEYFNCYEDFFYAVHKELDTKELIDHLYNETNLIQSIDNYTELKNDHYVWFKED